MMMKILVKPTIQELNSKEHHDAYINENVTFAFLGICWRTMHRYKQKGMEPNHMYFQGRKYYKISDLIEWKKQHMRSKDVADVLGVHVNSIHHWRKYKPDKLKFRKVEGSFFYNYNDVMKLKKEREKKKKKGK